MPEINHPFVIPLTKIDHERRLVIGVAAEEGVDRSKEIMDYASARPQFEEWSKGFQDATGGLSKGNLRVMHTKTVAGRLDDIHFDDATKRVSVVAKVSDDNEWRKVLDGVYTGFSIGGGYLKKWNDPETPGVTRYTPVIRELSLVDNPCMPTARFAELVKADGLVEQIELRGVARTYAQQKELRKMAAAAKPKTYAERRQAQHDELHRLAKGFSPAKFDRFLNSAASRLSGSAVGRAASAVSSFGREASQLAGDAGAAAGRGIGLVASAAIGHNKRGLNNRLGRIARSAQRNAVARHMSTPEGVIDAIRAPHKINTIAHQAYHRGQDMAVNTSVRRAMKTGDKIGRAAGKAGAGIAAYGVASGVVNGVGAAATAVGNMRGNLSEAQREQRREAAKARWAKVTG